jgi:hypothetical protein
MGKPWFTRRRNLLSTNLWGYQYWPITWEGMALIFILIAVIIGSSLLFGFYGFSITLVVLIVASILVSDYKCDDPIIFTSKSKR